ncbi:MAG: insulinase family protein [Deltaproteobacteria bacterium]|nr:insulinase family protein [Deltaproteobacteria bacterium]
MRNSLLLFSCLSLSVGVPATAEARIAVQRSVLENGIVLLSSEQNTLPMVTLTLLIRAGSRYDPAAREGLANLTARLLTYGTKTRSAVEINETLDFIGASLSTACSEDVATLNLTVLKKDLDTGLSLLAELLTESIFPEQEIEREKQSIIASIRAKYEEPGEVAQMKFMEALFPQSRYGRPVEGTADSVRAITGDGPVEFYRQYYRPNRAILAVVGNITHQEMTQRISTVFQSWKKGPTADEAPPSVLPGPSRLVRIDQNLTQANIIVGHVGVPRSHPDYYAIQVMNYVLGGGGFSSRLMDSIRNERGLAYSVYSSFGAEKFFGTFQIVMQTKNESAGEAIRIAREEIQKIREKGASREELNAAKDFLVGSFPLRIDTNRKVASFLAQVEFLELGLDYPDRYPNLIRAVTQEDVLRAARRYLDPEKLIVVAVADQGKAGIQQ